MSRRPEVELQRPDSTPAAENTRHADGYGEQEAFVERMNVLIQRAGGPGELARKSGLSRRVIDKYRGGDSDPSRERLVRLASAGGVSVAWLATGEGAVDPRAILPQGSAGDFVALPRYEVRAAAGAGSLVETEYIADFVHFNRHWLHRALGANPEDLVLLEATGDSMADTINSGDLLIVDAAHPRFRGDGVYVLSVDESLMVKRVGLRLAGGVRVSSDNPRYPEVLDVPREDAERRVRFVGKVVWSGGVL